MPSGFRGVALRLLHAYGRDDVPVAEGAAGALLGSVVRATEVHGEPGGRGLARLLAIPRSQIGRRIMEAMESVQLADVVDNSNAHRHDPEKLTAATSLGSGLLA